jgi:hypothetical protein
VDEGVPGSPPGVTTTPAAPTRTPLRWALPVALGCGVVMVTLGALRAAVSGETRPLVGALVLLAVVAALLVPMQLMQRSGRGIAAPMGTPESRWSLVAFAGVQAVAAGAGAVWAASAGHTVFALALGAWFALCLVGLVAALVGPAESMRGRRPGEQPVARA